VRIKYPVVGENRKKRIEPDFKKMGGFVAKSAGGGKKKKKRVLGSLGKVVGWLH